MRPVIDLVWLGEAAPPAWPLGRVLRAEGSPAGAAAAVAQGLPGSDAVAWLFWSSRLGAPDPARVERALALPGDLWHAGLRLGVAGLPRAVDYVAPTWMLNRDPDPAIDATSWRLSLEACLVRTEVLSRLGFVRPEFTTLAAAGLELGHRYVRAGALTRHVGGLAGEGATAVSADIPLEDELRFARLRYGRIWSRWALLRMALTGRASLVRGLRILRRIDSGPQPPPVPAFRTAAASPAEAVPAARGTGVTVLVPTVDRYPYLDVLLDQLRRQTVRPLEIVIVDQTAPGRRRADLAERFSDLPIRLLTLDRAGQCSSRNAGIESSRGDYLLFLDDDDEVPADLIERHLAALGRFRNDVSCGVADEDGAGPLPEAFRLTRISDVFPTNNSMIRMSALSGSGLFDLAYDRGARADADLGMRLYLAGNLMVLDSDNHVLHRHAPSGGLRTHGARVITYASSRKRIWHRHLPSKTELYLARRYFNAAQVREMYWLTALGTFSVRGGALKKAAKVAAALLLLPHTLWTTRQRMRLAEGMLAEYPQIPKHRAGARTAAAG